MALPRLTVLDGRYAIGHALDASQSLVFAYQAWNLHTEDQVVLQEFFPSSYVRRAAGSFDVEAVNALWEELFQYGRDQFLKETVVLEAIEHANLVRVLEHFEAHGTVYRVLEHHKGATLASVLENQGGKLPPKTAFTILIPLLDALQAAHQRGLIHGAFSPKAVFLAKGRGPLLRGFRTTHVMLAQRTGDRQLLVEEGISAPEQYETGGRQGPWTDIYGSAATLFRMLTGQALPAASRRMQKDETAALLHQAGDLPAALCDLLEQALSLDSARRPRSAQAFRQQLLDTLTQKADPVLSAPSEEEIFEEQTAEPEPEAPPSASPEAAVEEETLEIVEEATPVAVEEETPLEDETSAVEAASPVEEEPVEAVEEAAPVEETAPVEEATPVAVEEEAAPVEEPEVVSVVEEQENQAAQKVAARAARVQGTKAARPQRPSGPRRQLPDRRAIQRRRRGVPVLAALAVVVLIAFSGAYVLMQGENSEVGQFAYFKAQGDSLFATANYIEAKTQYENALIAWPDNEYVTNRLGETQQRLAEVSDIRYDQYLTQGDVLYTLGDSLLDAGNFQEAVSSFAEANKAFYKALRYRPNDPVALEKDRLTTAGMEAALNKNKEQNGPSAAPQAEQDPAALQQERYSSHRRQGDALFARGDYAAAREKFSIALEAVPGDAYAAARVEEIDTLLEEQGRDEQVEQLLTQGAALNNEERYTEARIIFRQAQDLKPGDQRAAQGLAYADSMLAAADRDKEYQRLRDEGDALQQQDKPAEALVRYQQALAFKPDDAYAKRQIQAIQNAQEAQRQAVQQPATPPQQPQPKEDATDDGIYSVVEEAPELIGGLKELYSKVQYPEGARRLSIEGRVYVQFVLTENGQVQDAKVIRGIGGGCDEEALRVVKEARFVPGRIGGRPVKMRHTLFVSFRLNR